MAYTSSKIRVGKSKISKKGVFAKERIEKGKMICDFAGSKGKIYSTEERMKNPRKWGDYDIQIDDDLFFGATKNSELEPCDYINHSCDPNCGIKGALKIVAMRNIKAGEEITFDYAMSESHPMRIECACGRPNCRKILTGNDWKKKGLRKKYRGFFSDYLAEKIKNQAEL